MLDWVAVDCPYCGEVFETDLDLSAGDQSYVEDCRVCCCPILLTISVGAEGELTGLEARRENE